MGSNAKSLALVSIKNMFPGGVACFYRPQIVKMALVGLCMGQHVKT